ncbi:hypothetical protein AB0J83_11090 [Actinoplanes sp. NPDC049596]|uniref:hypothetical protein n=1 Tax=unclassified Actinoplanes TaxID=2626549 RepID=UPI003415F148
MATDVIRVMPDYQSYPTWRPGTGEYNVDPEKLPISKELADELNAWGDEYDATLVLDDPASSGFPDAAAEEDFAERGLRLAQRLAAEVAGRFQVEYHDIRTGRRQTLAG